EMQECSVCERTVRQYVQERKRALGLVVNEVFVPQSYDWGVEAQVDWYEAVADLAGERIKLQVFSMGAWLVAQRFTARFGMPLSRHSSRHMNWRSAFSVVCFAGSDTTT